MLHISTAGHARANFNAALNVTASMQKALLCGVSVLACGVVLGGTPAAQAQTIGTSTASTVNSTGADITVLTNVVLSGTPFGIANATLTNSITNGGTVSNKYTGIYNSGTLNVFSNTGTISGLTGVVNAFGGNIQTLTNSGSISGSQYGIYNFGVINQLTNASTGVIATSGARSSAINNSGSIGRLTNNGTIAGGARGIYNYVTSNSAVAAYIGVLTNNGLISSRSNSAITNTGNSTIGVLSNTGTISGPGGIFNYGRADIGVLTNGTLTNGTLASNALIRGGLYNAGTIGVLTNDGTISGANAVIYNTTSNSAGSIGVLTNNGLITGQTGIHNSGTILTLTNFGTISGGAIGIDNLGTIGALDNGVRGTITSSSDAIKSSSGGLGVLTNSGLISGNIDVLNQNLNIIGGSGANFGTLSGGLITLSAQRNLNLSGNLILADSVEAPSTGPAPIIIPGGGPPLPLPFLGSIGTLTNSGVLQIGSSNAPATISVIGNYTQTSAGALNVIVTPTASSQMNVTGAATLAGALNYVFAPGTYTPHTYAFLNAGTISGNFTTINYDNIPINAATTTIVGDPTDNLVINSGFTFTGQGQVVSPNDAAIFSAQTQALAQATQQTNASLLGIAGVGGAAASPACNTQIQANPNSASANGVADAGRIAQAIAAEFCSAGGWVQASGSRGHVGVGDGASAYNADNAGFLAGIDKVVGPADTRVGLAVGYDETSISDKSGGKANMGTTRVAVYAAQPLGAFNLAATLGYGYAGNNTSRADGIGNIKANNNLSIINAAVQASTDVKLRNVTVTPEFGVRLASVQATHFAESGNGLGAAFAVHGQSQTYNSVQPYAQATAHESFVTASGFVVSPSVTIGIQDEAGNRGHATSVFAADGTAFQTAHNTLDPLAALLGAGLSASKNNLTLFIDYTAQIAGNWNTQTGEAGLRVNF